MTPPEKTVSELNEIAFKIRVNVLRMLNSAGSGHLGGSLGLADIFAALYFKLLQHNPDNPEWPERDRVILSAGHLVPVHYAALAMSGYFPVDELFTLRQLGSRLQGHPAFLYRLPGIETSSGSLGQGLGIGVGMALAAKMRQEKYKIVTIHGDGELQEGSIWEAAMSASHFNLSNLIAIIDRNGVQIDGTTEMVMALEPLADKWKSFGWNVLECNGNSMTEFLSTYQKAANELLKPSVILARTMMGAGVPCIENDYTWHGKVPNDEEMERFEADLKQKYYSGNE
jgi:transketolase